MRRRLLGNALIVPLGDSAALAAVAGVLGTSLWARLSLVVVGLAAMAASGLVEPPMNLRLLPQIPRLVAVSLLVSSVGIVTGDRTVSVATLVSTWALVAVALVTARFVEYRLVAYRRRRGAAERAVVVGAGLVGSRVAQTLLSRAEYGVLPMGFVDDEVMSQPLTLPLLGSSASLERIIGEHAVERVIIAFGSERESNLVTILRSCWAAKVGIDVVPRLFELGATWAAGKTHDLGGIPLVRMRRAALRSVRYAVGRAAPAPLSLSHSDTRPFDGSVSVVIPALNEAENLPWVLERIPPFVDEVVLVDGWSTDNSDEVARSVFPGIRVIHAKPRGKGAALRAGIAAARGDAVVILDADGSMDPREIPVYLDALSHGYEFVKGSRFMAGGGSEDLTFIRRIGNRGLMGCVNVLFRSQFTDLCYGYCAFRRESLPRLRLRTDGFEIETEMSLNAILAEVRIAEVPSLEFRRRSGRSNLSAVRDGWRIAKTLLNRRFTWSDSWAPPPVDAMEGSPRQRSGVSA